jgi:hypothetical protein
VLGKKVEIIDETNFYWGMIGKIIQVEPRAVLVEIRFTLNITQNVWFFTEQVEIID